VADATTIDLGDPLPDLSVEVTDASGALADATTVTLTITLPDATTTAPTVTRDSLGVYSASYTPTQRGRHVASWAATGTNASAFTTVYNVVDPAASVVGLAEMQAYLQETRTSQQDAIRAVTEAATAAVEDYCNRAFRRTSYVEVYDGGKPSVFLRHTPILSVSSVVENGTATTDYRVNNLTGQLTKGSAGLNVGLWYPVVGALTVTYAAGAASIPQPVVEAVKMTAQSLYVEQAGRAPRAADEFAAPADLIPRIARLMLQPYILGGFGN
jgi:hypothetical protein